MQWFPSLRWGTFLTMYIFPGAFPCLSINGMVREKGPENKMKHFEKFSPVQECWMGHMTSLPIDFESVGMTVLITI